MSARYKIIDNEELYFHHVNRIGVDGCLPKRNGQVFTREIYKTILLDIIRDCQQSQGLKYMRASRTEPFRQCFNDQLLWHWIYSSATDFFTEKNGLLDIIILYGFRFED